MSVEAKPLRARLRRCHLDLLYWLHAGLCIELWKVTKVVEIKVDWENLVAGIIPRISYVDRPSYKSSTKEYDTVNHP